MSANKKKDRAPNIRDVAARAGVSYQTVSRVLNDSTKIRESTREAVLAAIRDTGYRPNQAARRLVTRRSGLIGVLSTHSTAMYGPQTMIIAMEQTANELGYQLSVATAGAEEDSITRGVTRLIEQHVEAIIVVAPQGKVFNIIGSLDSDVPVLALDSRTRGGVRGVAVDQFRGAREATRHLIELGHSDIVHIGGPRNWIEAEERMQGYLFEMREAELPVVPPVLGELTADFGYRAGLDLLSGRSFTAVLAINDQVALGLLHAFRDEGVNAPEQISVVGFDDVPEAAHYFPPLTTVRQDFAAVGRRVIRSALAEIGGETPSESVVLAPTLIVRSSTAVVPPRDRRVGNLLH